MKDEIIVQDSYDAFRLLMEYLITDQCNITAETVVELLGISSLIHLPTLKVICEKFLIQNLDKENVVSLLQVAKQVQSGALYSSCVQFLQTHFEAISKTREFISADEKVREDMKLYL